MTAGGQRQSVMNVPTMLQKINADRRWQEARNTRNTAWVTWRAARKKWDSLQTDVGISKAWDVMDAARTAWGEAYQVWEIEYIIWDKIDRGFLAAPYEVRSVLGSP